MKVVLRPAAVDDVRAARDYYERARSGLSVDFGEELDRVLGRLRLFPRSAPAVEGYPNVRRSPVRRFPFAIFYRVEDATIVVLRVVHTARDVDALRGE